MAAVIAGTGKLGQVAGGICSVTASASVGFWEEEGFFTAEVFLLEVELLCDTRRSDVAGVSCGWLVVPGPASPT